MHAQKIFENCSKFFHYSNIWLLLQNANFNFEKIIVSDSSGLTKPGEMSGIYYSIFFNWLGVA